VGRAKASGKIGDGHRTDPSVAQLEAAGEVEQTRELTPARRRLSVEQFANMPLTVVINWTEAVGK
jgi:hypothetical protein